MAGDTGHVISGPDDDRVTWRELCQYRHTFRTYGLDGVTTHIGLGLCSTLHWPACHAAYRRIAVQPLRRDALPSPNHVEGLRKCADPCPRDIRHAVHHDQLSSRPFARSTRPRLISDFRCQLPRGHYGCDDVCSVCGERHFPRLRVGRRTRVCAGRIRYLGQAKSQDQGLASRDNATQASKPRSARSAPHNEHQQYAPVGQPSSVDMPGLSLDYLACHAVSESRHADLFQNGIHRFEARPEAHRCRRGAA